MDPGTHQLYVYIRPERSWTTESILRWITLHSDNNKFWDVCHLAACMDRVFLGRLDRPLSVVPSRISLLASEKLVMAGCSWLLWHLLKWVHSWIEEHLHSHTLVCRFWMGDQFYSMNYSLTMLGVFAPVAGSIGPSPVICKRTGWPSKHPLIRFFQCLKRYADSKNYIHLINGGKYCTGYMPLIPLLLLVKTLSRRIIAISVFFNWGLSVATQNHHESVVDKLFGHELWYPLYRLDPF